MRKTLLIAFAVVGICALIGIVAYLALRPKTGSPAPSQATFPSATSTVSAAGGSPIPIPVQGGESIEVRNFLADAETKQDSMNAGYYYLGNQPPSPQQPAVPYLIEYIASTGYFNIALLQEPIGQARTEAESYLLQHLGLTQPQLCALEYMVTTPDSVNTLYSGENLGFSFCPGAVKLP